MAIEIRELIIKGKIGGLPRNSYTKKNGKAEIDIAAIKLEIMQECLDMVRKELSNKYKNW